MKIKTAHFILLFSYFLLSNAAVAPTQSYQFNQTLSLPDNLYLYWSYNDFEITFEVHVKNRVQTSIPDSVKSQYPNVSLKNESWFLLGFRNPLSVTNTTRHDLVVGWVFQDGVGHFSDRNSQLLTPNTLVIDAENNFVPLDAKIIENYSIFKFKRLILKCNSDNKEDIGIPLGNADVFYSFGNLYDFKNFRYDLVLFNSSQSRSQIEFKNVQLVPQTNQYACPLEPEVPRFTSQPTGYYPNYVDLVEGIYRLYWNYTDTEFIGEIHCKTQGWVGFGFSPNGGMDKSDVVIGWISNEGKVNFTDRFITGTQVNIDRNQSVQLLYSSEQNSYTIFKFKRNINLCDSEDKIIENGSPYVIFAWGENDPLPGQDISYHGNRNRGQKKVNLLTTTQAKNEYFSDSIAIDFTVANALLPRDDTFYYCELFEIPKNLTIKHHIYKYEVLFAKRNLERYHHFLVYECMGNYNGEPAIEPTNCFTNVPRSQYCMSITTAWGVGSDSLVFYPKDTGYPIGGNSDYKYIVIETHYDNPLREIGFIEQLTLRFHATKNLRKNELGVLTIGTQANPQSIAIPPKEAAFPINAYCYSDCTQKQLASSDITVIMALSHTHLTGIDVGTRIIRNDQDIGYLYRNKYYDFDYQFNGLISPPVVLKKGDALITKCIYNTLNRDKFTLGGESTRKEMCFQFLTYYPRSPSFKYCVSNPDYTATFNFLVELNKTNDVQMPPVYDSSYETIFNAMSKAYETLDITDPMRKRDKFANFFNTTTYNLFCGFVLDYDSNPRAKIVPDNTYVDKDVCLIQKPQTNILTTIIQFFKSLFNTLFGWLFSK